jgi:membrane protein
VKDKLAAFQRSRVGQFVRKVLDDRAPNLAVLLAWGTLNTLLPLFLGVLALAGFVLRDPEKLASLTASMFSVLPAEAAQTLQGILETTADNAGAAGIVSLVLLLFSGTNFFSNMQMVFNLAYHVEDRNMVLQRVVALVMLFVGTALLLVSTTAYGLGNTIGSLPIAVPVGPVLGRAVGWAVCIISALVTFLLLYKVLPNKPQSWRQAIPGTAAATVLFFAVLQLFPLYLSFFGGGFKTYAAFGVFLLLMFWLYLLGLILVLGAELNAFLEEPGRATALAAIKAQAEKGQAAVGEEGGQVTVAASATGQAGAAEAQRTGPFGADRMPTAPEPTADAQHAPPGALRPTSVMGKLLGLAGLAVAVFVLSRDQSAAAQPTAQP